MADDKMTLMVIAIVAIVAIIAAFGIVNATGMAVMKDRVMKTSACDVFWDQCSFKSIGDRYNCEQCCALSFACDFQRGVPIEDARDKFLNGCMPQCGISDPNVNPGEPV